MTGFHIHFLEKGLDLSNSGGLIWNSAVNFSAMSSAILNVQALKLEWIQIGCQRFIFQQLEKNPKV